MRSGNVSVQRAPSLQLNVGCGTVLQKRLAMCAPTAILFALAQKPCSPEPGTSFILRPRVSDNGAARKDMILGNREREMAYEEPNLEEQLSRPNPILGAIEILVSTRLSYAIFRGPSAARTSAPGRASDKNKTAKETFLKSSDTAPKCT